MLSSVSVCPSVCPSVLLPPPPPPPLSLSFSPLKTALRGAAPHRRLPQRRYPGAVRGGAVPVPAPYGVPPSVLPLAAAVSLVGRRWGRVASRFILRGEARRCLFGLFCFVGCYFFFRRGGNVRGGMWGGGLASVVRFAFHCGSGENPVCQLFAPPAALRAAPAPAAGADS